MNGHRNLPVWNESKRLVGVIYRLTRTLPIEERFVVNSQMRRAAWSVHNNIAEANGRRGRRQFCQYVDVALGSLAEVDAMAATISEIYEIDSTMIAEIEEIRKSITAQLMSLLRTARRQTG